MCSPVPTFKSAKLSQCCKHCLCVLVLLYHSARFMPNLAQHGNMWWVPSISPSVDVKHPMLIPNLSHFCHAVSHGV
jgi:hypothetical protein